MINGTKEQSVNRTYKSRLFELVFSDKRELLKLYNAINGTSYTDSGLLEINTLENAIYMSMHNDLSFIIDLRLTLYEHQSTYSPNLPLRFLFYAADLYSAITKDVNLYGHKLVKIPTPRFVIFYNGTETLPDIQEMRLSSAFTVQEKEHSLELVATLININPGHNETLMEACKTLKDYTEYTERVRRYADTMDIELAVELAITECIKEGILAEFLKKNRAEARKVSIYEYDEEKHMRQVKEEGREEGYMAGREDGLSQGLSEGLSQGQEQGRQEKLYEQVQRKLQKGKSLAVIADELEEDVTVIEAIVENIEIEKPK